MGDETGNVCKFGRGMNQKLALVKLLFVCGTLLCNKITWEIEE